MTSIQEIIYLYIELADIGMNENKKEKVKRRHLSDYNQKYIIKI